MTDSPADSRFTVQDALELFALAAGRPRLLNASASLDRAVRWSHIIGQDHPGSMLRGGELVLSTLPRLDEGRENLEEVLRVYLRDLDAVDAAALAVEVLPDRPRLLSALHAVVQERETAEGVVRAMPVLLFERVVRFVEITEAVHRQLVSRQMGIRQTDALERDPLLSATTNLFDDLAAPGGLPETEVSARAMALGMPAESRTGRGNAPSVAPQAFTALVFHAEGSSGTDSGARPPMALAGLIRETAARMHAPTLVGSRAGDRLSVLVAQADPARLCLAVREEAARRRSRELVPRYIVAAGQLAGRDQVTLQESPLALAHAAEVAATASMVMERSTTGGSGHPRPVAQPGARSAAHSAARSPAHSAAPHELRSELRSASPPGVRERGYWRADDLGLKGLLVHLASHQQSRSSVEWFLDHHLAPLRGRDREEMRALVRAMSRTGGNKAGLARELGISRPTLYARIERLERSVGRPLEGETLTLLQTALLLEELQG